MGLLGTNGIGTRQYCFLDVDPHQTSRNILERKRYAVLMETCVHKTILTFFVSIFSECQVELRLAVFLPVEKKENS